MIILDNSGKVSTLTQYKEPMERLFTELKHQNDEQGNLELLLDIKKELQTIQEQLEQTRDSIQNELQELSKKLDTLDAGQVVISQRLFHIEKELFQLKKQEKE